MKLIGRVIGGFVGVFVAIGLLWWNEGRAVRTYKDLKEGAANCISIDATNPDAANEGKLVYFNGDLEVFDSIVDSDFNVKVLAVELDRSVEMYQWKEKSETDEAKNEEIYSYYGDWSSTLVRTSSFEFPAGHENPDHFPVEATSFIADPVKIDEFEITEPFINRLYGGEDLGLGNQDLQSTEFGDRMRVTQGKTLFIGYGTPENPSIGDVRVKYKVTYPTEVSVVGQQQGNQLVSYVGSRNTNINLLEKGVLSQEQMFEEAQKDNVIMTWLLRIGGIFLMFASFMAILSPLTKLMDYIPLVGDLINSGIGLIAGLFALMISLMVIAVAWIFYRPVLGIILLAAVGGIITYLIKLKKTNKQQV